VHELVQASSLFHAGDYGAALKQALADFDLEIASFYQRTDGRGGGGGGGQEQERRRSSRERILLHRRSRLARTEGHEEGDRGEVGEGEEEGGAGGRGLGGSTAVVVCVYISK
jgi:hypothetical protein